MYRLAADEYFLVVNASMVDADVQWMSDRLPDDVTLENSSAEFGGIAVQGPQAADWFATIQRAAGEPSPVPLPDRFGILELPRSMAAFWSAAQDTRVKMDSNCSVHRRSSDCGGTR